MSLPPKLIAERYRLLDRLGSGAMGEVWKAQDLRFERRFVAIKLLREEDTHREDAANRERLQRLLREETDDGRLSVTLGVSLLDEVLQSGKGVEQLRTHVKQKADLFGRLRGEAVLGLYDELVDDPSCCESARIRAKLRRLFRDEANSVADLRHDNIVSISDYGEDGGVPYLAMDYIDGQTLLRLIQRGEPLPRARQLRFMEDLCGGLAYAHKRHLVHRDIKPANLIVEHGTDSLKILDFGVVKRLKDTHESTMGLPIGTLCYMSPEQIVGSAALDSRSDIFSVGSVFYELLTGHKAFPAGQGMADLMARIQREPPPSVRDVVPDLEPAIETVLNRALRKDPDERYQSLTDMQRDLARIRTQIEHAAEEADRTLVGDHGETTLVIRQAREPLFPRLLRRGEQALEMGDVTLALESADKVLELDPTNKPALDLQERARALDRSRKLAQGIEQARSQLAAGDLSNARKTSQQLREIDADAPSVKDIVAEIERVVAAREEARLRAERVGNLLAIAEEQLNAGAFEDAIAAAHQALQLAPGNEAVRNLAADAEARLAARREREAQAAAREREIQSLAARAEDAMRARDFDAAVRRLRDARDLAPDRGDLAQRLDEAERALEQERRRSLLRKSVADARDLLARGRFTEAADALDRARAIDPADADAQAVGREIVGAREAHDARLAQERAEADATVVVHRADQLFTKGARQEALDLLAGQQTLHPRIAERLRALQDELARLTREEEERKEREAVKRRIEAEQARLKAEREKAEEQRREAERQKAEAVRVESERKKAEERRLEAERQKAEKLRLEAERTKAEELRLEAERTKAEQLRLEAERTKAEELRLETERKKAEQLHLEAERQKAEAVRAEVERKKAEQLHLEAERQKAEQLRVETERQKAEQLRVETERQKAEQLRVETDRQKAEQLRVETDRQKAELLSVEAERKKDEQQRLKTKQAELDTEREPVPEPVPLPLPQPRPVRILAAAALLAILALGAGLYYFTRGQPGSPPSGGTSGQGGAAAHVTVGVTVVLQPWARVRIEGKQGASAPSAEFTTPFNTELAPGKYVLHCENGGLTAKADVDIEVLAGQPLVVNQAMPGFDPAQVLDKLLGPSR
jgi:eukaryotic-like serine/threonine-protein kinase